ncbi:MAG: nucleoside triphosphate pyrophosphohydrolase [Rhodospirillaceae bacterium]|nr:nucleoside triphosphate pyrophosphohydrolase [Rhodospirillaceae bacterium]
MSSKIDELLAVMRQLRDPETGCPWDREQNYASIAPYTIEEAYEVSDAIERNDIGALKSELGDLLFQVVFHARMAEEDGDFDFEDVVEAITEKMTRRHPHVFAGMSFEDAEAQTANWEAHKAEERRQKAESEGRMVSILEDVPVNLPALLRAEKLTKRAARVGFDWPETNQVVAKIDEELEEVKAEIAAEAPLERLQDEIGDLLFTVANLARHFKIDPETALKDTNRKFVERFQYVEQSLHAAGERPEDSGLERMEALWQEAKIEAKN